MRQTNDYGVTGLHSGKLLLFESFLPSIIPHPAKLQAGPL
jgi:hypothetical protein